MYCHGPIFKTNIYVFACIVSNDSCLHPAVHHSGFAKTVFCRGLHVWISDYTFFKLAILSMFYNSVIFKTNINISAISISNNGSFHTAIHHSSFSKTSFGGSTWVSNFPFFKRFIRFIFCHSPIFKTHVNVFACIVSNDSCLHPAVHHFGFPKAVFSGSFNVGVVYFTFFKRIIPFMFYHSPIFETNINICRASISNNSSFHTTIHHSGFSKTGFGGSVWMSDATFFK